MRKILLFVLLLSSYLAQAQSGAWTKLADGNSIRVINKKIQIKAPNGIITTPGGVTIVSGGGGGGSGDMLKATYDSNNDGKVSSAVNADIVPWAGITGKLTTYPPSTHGHSQSDITALDDSLVKKLNISNTNTFSRSLLNATTSGTWRTLLSLVIGTDVLAPGGNGAGLTNINPANISWNSTYTTLSSLEKASFVQNTLSIAGINLTSNITVSAFKAALGGIGTVAPLAISTNPADRVTTNVPSTSTMHDAIEAKIGNIGDNIGLKLPIDTLTLRLKVVGTDTLLAGKTYGAGSLATNGRVDTLAASIPTALTKASTGQATIGTDDATYMTPQKTKEAILALGSGVANKWGYNLKNFTPYIPSPYPMHLVYTNGSNMYINGSGTGVSQANISAGERSQTASLITTGTTATGISGITTGLFGTGGIFRLGTDIWVAQGRSRLVNLPDATEDFEMYLGFTSGLSLAPGSQIAFRIRWNGTTVDYQAVTRTSSVETATTFTVADATAYFNWKIIATTTSVSFYINDVIVGSPHTTNIPGSTINILATQFMAKKAGLTARQLYALEHWTYSYTL